ncbi:MAG: FlgD immunoglobulin-like domain containing protein [bacterium]
MRRFASILGVSLSLSRSLPLLLPLVLTLALALAPAERAHAFLIVDDFEVGTVNLIASDDTLDALAAVNGGWHSAAPSRLFRLMPSQSGGGVLSARVTPGTTWNDYLRIETETGQGAVSIEWDWLGSRDLTEFGVCDSVQILFTQVSGGGCIVSVTTRRNSLEATRSDTVFAAGECRIKFPYADYVEPSGAHAMRVKFEFLDADAGASIRVADIRTLGSGRITPKFVGEWTLVTSSPLPSAPCTFLARDPLANPLYRTGIGFYDIQTGGPTPVINGVWDDWQIFDGEFCEIVMSTVPKGGYLYDWSGTYEFFIDVTATELTVPELAYPPDPIIGPRSIGVPLAITLRDAMGAPLGQSSVMLAFDILGTQPAQFGGATTIPVMGIGGAITGLRVQFELIPDGVILDSQPVFQIAWQSDYAGDAATGVDAVAPPAAPRGNLVAMPSVTRGATEFRAAQPFANDAVLRLHDASGRLIRELLPAAGAAAIRWDGTEPSGGRVAAGTYFARRSDRPGDRAARVVLMR